MAVRPLVERLRRSATQRFDRGGPGQRDRSACRTGALCPCRSAGRADAKPAFALACCERPRRRHQAKLQLPYPWRLLAEGMARLRSRRSEEHTSELQSLMRISYAVFCLKKNTKTTRESM